MTNKRLSELMAVHVNTISYWKNQDSLPQIGGDTLNSLCKFLECTPFDLIEYTPDAIDDNAETLERD